ncbi:hypothetical protein RCL1_008679 [Eukaryota sp. TZLM3-RCL]
MSREYDSILKNLLNCLEVQESPATVQDDWDPDYEDLISIPPPLSVYTDNPKRKSPFGRVCGISSPPKRVTKSKKSSSKAPTRPLSARSHRTVPSPSPYHTVPSSDRVSRYHDVHDQWTHDSFLSGSKRPSTARPSTSRVVSKPHVIPVSDKVSRFHEFQNAWKNDPFLKKLR